MSEEDGDDAGIASESSSSLMFSGSSFFLSDKPLQKMKIAIIFGFCILHFLYHKIDLITK